MSIVAMSETVGSGGSEIGRALAAALGWEFADREIITKAAESFGEGVGELRHATEEKPTLWDRFRQSQQRYDKRRPPLAFTVFGSHTIPHNFAPF